MLETRRQTFMSVLAHPDDESLACGGTLALLAARGARVVIVCASRGERGTASGEIDHDLGRLRVGELRDAARCLGASQLIVLDYPDGDLRGGRSTELVADIRTAIAQYRPAAVITFGADGLYWHPDHIVIHERTTSAVWSMDASAPALYYVTMPRHVMPRIVECATAVGWTAPSVGLWSLPPDSWGSAAAPPDLVIDVGKCVSQKIAAIRSHFSQVGHNPLNLVDGEDLADALSVEHFHRAGAIGAGAMILEKSLQGAVEP